MSKAKERETEVATPNLFEQTKDLIFIGERLSGDPEIIHEIQACCEFEITRKQIKRILQLVPDVFPEDWKSPDSYTELTPEQQSAFHRLPGPFFHWTKWQEIIAMGVAFRNRFQNKEIEQSQH